MKQMVTIGFIWFTVFLFPVPGLAQQKAPEGVWFGNWMREGSTVVITMRISRSASGYEGSFDSEGLRVIGIPMQNIQKKPPKLRWEVAGDFAKETYEAVLRNDSLTGNFTQGNATGTLAFMRAKHDVTTTKREEIAFASGDVMLSGTVLIPAGPGPIPRYCIFARLWSGGTQVIAPSCDRRQRMNSMAIGL
jgi:hypothetical protein